MMINDFGCVWQIGLRATPDAQWEANMEIVICSLFYVYLYVISIYKNIIIYIYLYINLINMC